MPAMPSGASSSRRSFMACKQPGKSYMGSPALPPNLGRVISLSQICQGHDAQLTLRSSAVSVLLCLTVWFFDAVRGLGALTVRSPL